MNNVTFLKMEEADMRLQIERVLLHRLNMTLKNPFATSFGTVREKEFFIVEVIDHHGNHGFGESVAFTTPWYTEETTETNFHIMKDFLIPLLQQNELTHPDDASKLFSLIKGNNMAKAAIEGAIWDLYAKQQNITLAEALGGTRDKIAVGISLGLEEKFSNLVKKIETALENGFQRIKLKIKPGMDVELLREVRRVFPTVPLMADANSAYTLYDIDHLKKLDEFDLMMIEQPLEHDDIVDHAQLQKQIVTPICLDESIYTLDDVRKAHELGSCKVINLKIGRVGGLTEAKRIHDYCQENDLALWCGGMLEAGVGRAHNIALTSLSHFTLPGDTAGSAHYWEKDIITPEVIVENGYIRVPEAPGIGYELDEEAFARYKVSTTEFTC